MTKLTSSTVGLSYLLLLAPFSSAQPAQCPTPEYCGGSHGSPESEMSCTPFPARFDDAPSQSWYDGACVNNQNLSLLTGGNPYGAKAWRDNGKKSDHYWVFHGCDKAGTMDDVCEQTGYTELIGPYSDETTPLTLHDCSGVGEGWEKHCSQPFVHPGTGKVYSYYWAGMMAWNSDGNWADRNKPWWSNMGLPDMKDLGVGDEEGTGFVVVYPWVCGYYGEDLAYLWGHHQPYGDSTDGTKCYYDNEPWNNDHWHGTTIPPVWKAYKFVSDGNKVKGWLLAEKKGDSQDPEYYLGSDNSFELRSMHGKGKKNGPWEGGLELEIE